MKIEEVGRKEEGDLATRFFEVSGSYRLSPGIDGDIAGKIVNFAIPYSYTVNKETGAYSTSPIKDRMIALKDQIGDILRKDAIIIDPETESFYIDDTLRNEYNANASHKIAKLFYYLRAGMHGNTLLEFKFNDTVPVMTGLRKLKLKNLKKITLKIFESDGNLICFSTYKNGRYGREMREKYWREGHRYYYIPYESVKRVSLAGQKSRPKQVKYSWFHKDFWRSITEKYDTDEKLEKFFSDSHKSKVYLSSKFPKHILEDFRQAVKDRKKWSHFVAGTRRDYTLSVAPAFDEDGNDNGVNAWFSSEYAGCGNGSYYIVVNPNLAIHGEDD